MCRYQQLAILETGYIIRCKQCEHYQIHFAKVILSLCEQDFYQLLKQIEVCIVENDAFHDPDRTVILNTPKIGVHLLLSQIELLQLRDMAEIADNEVKTLEMLDLFTK